MTDQNTTLPFERPVHVDIETDGIVSILVGDQVEPRREFIDKNALNVRKLDV